VPAVLSNIGWIDSRAISSTLLALVLVRVYHLDFACALFDLLIPGIAYLSSVASYEFICPLSSACLLVMLTGSLLTLLYRPETACSTSVSSLQPLLGEASAF
jgi:hypothetical protein